MSEHKAPIVGDVVVFHDPLGRPFNSIVIAVWSPTCINVVTIEEKGTRTDSYGRQIRRPTSIQHISLSPVHGYNWRWPEETPNPIVHPAHRRNLKVEPQPDDI